MQSTLKDLPTGNLHLSVELNRDDLAPYLARAEQELVGQVQVDGFRAGKVPLEVARKRLDQAAVRQAALELALEESLAATLDDKKIEARKVTDLNIEENGAEKLRYTVVAHPFPSIQSLPDLAAVSIERKPVAVSAAEIDEALEVVRSSRSKFSAKPGPAEIGDRVEVDFSVRLGDKVIDGGESKNHPLIIGGKSFLPGFEEALIGLKAGESKDFPLPVPADYFHKPIAGKTLACTATIKSVQWVEKPELTDDFAKTLGSFATLADLRQRIREGLEEEKTAKERQRVRLAALEALVENSKITLPESAREDQLDGMLADFDRDLHGRGMELGMYLAHLGKTQDELRRDWRKDAERQVKIAALVHRIGKDNKLAPTAVEIDQALAQAAQAAATSNQLDPNQLDLAALRRSVTEQLATEKALLFIENACVKA